MSEPRRVITELALQNVLKIKAIRIKPPKTAVTITGKNAQGKSSVLTGIEMVLCGKSSFPEKPVRDGQTKAAGQIDLGDYIVTRHISPHSLEIKSKASGDKVQRPQEFLDSLLSKYTFDPLRILRLSGREQLDEVKRILGIDFSEQDAEYNRLYEARRDLKRDINLLGFEIRNMGAVKETKRVSIEDLFSRLRDARAVNDTSSAMRKKLDAYRAEIVSLKEKKDRLEKELSIVNSEIDRVMAEGSTLKKAVDSIVDIDTSVIEDQIAASSKINDDAAKYESLVEKKTFLSSREDELSAMETRMAEIDSYKKSVIKSAEMSISIDGVSFDDSGSLLLRGVPLSQASQAEQIKVCMALAMRDNPNIGVVLIREASLLDSDSVDLIVDIAEKNGFQVWLEKVDDTSGVSFVIEDGELVGEPTKIDGGTLL